MVTFAGLFNLLSAQDLIVTDKSLVLVYNLPENYFYVQINGKDKQQTERQTFFIIDNRPVQILAVNTSKFMSEKTSSFTPPEVLTKYVGWESDYIKANLFPSLQCKTEKMKSAKGRDLIFWTYDMPIDQYDQKNDSTRKQSVRKQLFVLTLAKDYVVGINTPLMLHDNYDESKQFLLTNIDGIVEQDKEIDVNELNRELNR